MKHFRDRNGPASGRAGAETPRGCAAAAVAVCFVLSAFTLMNFLYAFANLTGSVVCGSYDVAVRDALRSLPILLSPVLSLSGLMTAQAFYRNESAAILRRKARKHALIAVVTGAFIPLYVIAMRLSGRFLSLAEGGPSRLYPLDAVIYALAFLALGLGVLRFFKANGRFAGPSRAPDRKPGFIRCVFRAVWLQVGLYSFCAFFFSIFILDFSAGYVPYCLAVLLVALVNLLLLAVWEFYYNALNEAKRRAAALPLSLAALAASCAAAAAYMLALRRNPVGPANVGFGILPVAVTASVNLATWLFVATPLIVSVTALIKALFGKRKAGKGSSLPGKKAL